MTMMTVKMEESNENIYFELKRKDDLKLYESVT